MKISITQENYIFIRLMKKAKIYKPTKTAYAVWPRKKMINGLLNILLKKPGINPLMGWESSTDTFVRIKIRVFY